MSEGAATFATPDPVRVAIYDTQTGRITAVFAGDPTNASDQLTPGLALADLPSGDELTYWVNPDTGRANLRDQSPAVLSSSSVPADFSTPVSISRLRTGSVVTITGPLQSQTTVDDGTLQLTFGIAGSYRISVQAPFPALETVVIVNAY